MIAPMLIARHTMMLSEGVPEWVHLIPAGTFTGVDGRGPYTLKDPQAVIAASMANDARPVIDENHATDLAATTGQPSPARGYVVEMQSRDDGIWGRVDWTPPGQAMMTNREYRGISPVFTHTKDGTVLSILRAALTNNPNLAQLGKLHHQETGMDLARLRAALGLADTADETAIVVAVEANRTAIATHAQQMAVIATAAGLTAGVPVDQVVTALQAQRAGATDAQKMAATITNLETQVALMRNQSAAAAAQAFVDAAIKAGKPIVALRDHYIARHARDAAAVETEINAMVSINGGAGASASGGGAGAGGGAGTGAPNAADALTATDKSVASMMGLDPVKFAEFKQTQASSRDGRAA
jgi:phage I-like protein